MTEIKRVLPEIYILGRDQIPLHGTYYLVTGSGIYLHKENGIFEATVKVPQVSALPKMEATVSLKIQKLSAEDFGMCLSFVRKIAKRYHSEATNLIFYNVDNREYLIECPKQLNNGAGSESLGMRIPGYRLMGSIHSHPDFDAFHSPVDEHDEDSFDGLHIVIGHVLDSSFSMSATMVINGNRFPLLPEDVIDGLFPHEIETRVTVGRKTAAKKLELGTSSNAESKPDASPIEKSLLLNQLGYPAYFLPDKAVDSFEWIPVKETRYKMIAGPAKRYPKEWLNRVSKESGLHASVHQTTKEAPYVDANKRSGSGRNRTVPTQPIALTKIPHV